MGPEENELLDPRKHRSSGMKCRTCMYCAPKQEFEDQEPVIGRCRRHAPTMSGFPVVFLDKDWCGDHKLDGSKLNFVPIYTIFI